MTQNKSIHRATAVVPDKDSSVIGPNEAKDALNMRIGNYNPATGSIGIYKVLGNREVLNTLLPLVGDNKAIGWKDNDADDTLVFAVYNSNGNHAIYQYNTLTRKFKTIISGAILAFEPYAEVDMDIRGDILIWTDDINEPRTINMDRAIKGEYGPTITDWMIAQLHRPPSYPLRIFSNPVGAIFDENNPNANKSILKYVVAAAPKPTPEVTLEGYQFAWNYEYFDNIESRISDPSILNWNNGVYVIIPDSERDNYLNLGGQPNPYIVAIKFYYRIGNGGEWVLFKRLKNIASNYDTPANYGSKTLFVLLENLEDIPSIGGISAAALNLVDGIGRKVKNNLFADNRIVHAHITEGYNIELPGATIAQVQQIGVDQTNWRGFPIVYDLKYDLALAYYDKKGRLIGSKFIGTTVLHPIDRATFSGTGFGYYEKDTSTIIQNNRAFVLSSLPWNQVVDYGINGNPTGYNNSRIDIDKPINIAITPSTGQLIPAEIDTIKLLSKKHQTISSYLRTIVRVYYYYKDESDGWQAFYTNTRGKEFKEGSTTYKYYGVGFEFSSGEPINFSAEEDFYVSVIGDIYSPTPVIEGISIPVLNFQTDLLGARLAGGSVWKITDQTGAVLISKQEYREYNSVAPNNNYVYGSFRLQLDFADDGSQSGGGPVIYFKQPNLGQYDQYTVDISLYTKQKTPPITWNVVTDVTWNRDQFQAGIVGYYLGDSFFSAETRTTSDLRTQAWNYVIDRYKLSFPDPDQRWKFETKFQTKDEALGIISGGGYFSSMNINGCFNEIWDSDIGNAIVLDEEPVEAKLINTLRHSEQGISNTKINNIFAFNPANEETAPSSLGPITKTIALATDAATGENLHVVCKLGTTAMFLSRTLVQDNSGNSTLATSSRVFGSKNTYQQKNGAAYLRDVIRTDKGVAFFWDSTKKSFMQISNNGLDNVSEQRFFQSDSWRFSTSDDSFVGYDPFFKEINVVQSKGEGLSYNFKFDIYQGRRTFIDTELFANTGTKAFSFMKGRLFILGDNSQTLMNEVGYPASIKFVCNAQITENKDFQWVHYKNRTGLKWVFKLDSENGFTSDLQVSEFVNRKDYFEASIKRASNTLGGKYNGQFMDGAFLTFELSDFDNDQKDITFVEIGYSNSITNG